MQVDQRELLYAAKRKLNSAQIPTLILSDDSPYQPLERPTLQIYISQYATAYSDQCLSSISEQSLERRNKLPMPIACALIQKHVRGGKYGQALKILQTHIDRKNAEKLYVLTYNTAKINHVLGHLKNAVFYLENLLRQEPFFPHAIYDLAFLYSKSFNRNSEAMVLLQRHLSSVLKNNNLIHSAFLALSNDSKLTTAQISKTLANHNLSLANFFNLALLFKKKKELERSQDLFQQLHCKLLGNEQKYLENGKLQDIKLIILTKLNLIDIKQLKDDKLAAAKLAYFLKSNYSPYLDSQTISNLEQCIQIVNLKTFELQSLTNQPKEIKYSSQSHFNLTIPMLKVYQNLKSSSITQDKQSKAMKLYSSRKLKYLLSKQKEIQSFFKNLSIKKRDFPLNLKISIKNSIERAKKQINEYTLKENLGQQEYLKFEEQFQQKRRQKLIEFNDAQIYQSIDHILAELQNIQQVSKNNSRGKIGSPLSSLINQKVTSNANEKSPKTEKPNSFMVSKRDLMKKCANFKKQKISMNLCFQKKLNERKEESMKNQKDIQQCKIVKNQFEDILPEVTQGNQSHNQCQIDSGKGKASQRQSKASLKQFSSRQIKVSSKQSEISSKQVVAQIEKGTSRELDQINGGQRVADKQKFLIQEANVQRKQGTQKILQKSIKGTIQQKSVYSNNSLPEKNRNVSIKCVKLQPEQQPKQQSNKTSRKTLKILEKSSNSLAQRTEQKINIFIIKKDQSNHILTDAANSEQKPSQIALQQTKSVQLMQTPINLNAAEFQRAHTIDMSESECSLISQKQKADKSSKSQHSILHENSSSSLKNKENAILEQKKSQTQKNAFVLGQPIQSPKSSVQVIVNTEDSPCIFQQKSAVSQKNQDNYSAKSNQGQQAPQKQAINQAKKAIQNLNQTDQIEVLQNSIQIPNASTHDPLASTFQLTGFSKNLFGKFDQKVAPINTSETLQIFFSSNIKSVSAQPCPQIQEKLSEAQQLQKAGNLQQAYKMLTALYKQHKGEAEKQVILLAIGRLFELQHKYEEAQRTYFKCTKFNSAQAFLRLGSLLLKLGKVEAGIQNLQKAECIKRCDIEIQNKLVYAYSLRQQTMAKALNLAHNILKKIPNSIQTLIMTAGILEKQGLIKQAIQIVTQIDKVQSTEYIKHYLGILYLQDSNLSQAYNTFKDALSIKPDYIPSLIEVASIISDISSKQAIQILNKVLEKDPKNRKALARLGKIYESVQGDFQSAMRTYQTALDSQQNYESYIKIGDCLAKKQSYIEALLNYKQALNLKKTSAGYAKLALMYQMKSEYHKAIESYQSALSTIKEQPLTSACLDKKREYLMSIGKLSHKIGMFDAAIASFQEIIEGQESAQLYKLLGQSYFGKREHEVALQYFQKANNFAKGQDVEILENLAICLDQLEEYLASKAIYEKILRKVPNNIRCLNNLANIQLITGETNQAFQTFQMLLQQAPKNMQKRLKIADIYAQVGDWSKVEYHLLKCYRLKEHDTRVLQKLVTLYKQKRDMRMVAKYQKKLALRTNNRSKPKL